ncbi:MAG: hypothetical protein KAQ92_02975 [Candidatus Aenigmarchaeota archaeon]|nr:hypothetical protein [Candidatus Aenigmarchaeota archaeon]
MILNEVYISNKFKDIIKEKNISNFTISDFINLIEICLEDYESNKK